MSIPPTTKTIKVWVRQIRFQEVKVEVPFHLLPEEAKQYAIQAVQSKEPSQRFDGDAPFEWQYLISPNRNVF